MGDYPYQHPGGHSHGWHSYSFPGTNPTQHGTGDPPTAQPYPSQSTGQPYAAPAHPYQPAHATSLPHFTTDPNSVLISAFSPAQSSHSRPPAHQAPTHYPSLHGPKPTQSGHPKPPLGYPDTSGYPLAQPAHPPKPTQPAHPQPPLGYPDTPGYPPAQPTHHIPTQSYPLAPPGYPTPATPAHPPAPLGYPTASPPPGYGSSYPPPGIYANDGHSAQQQGGLDPAVQEALLYQLAALLMESGEELGPQTEGGGGHDTNPARPTNAGSDSLEALDARIASVGLKLEAMEDKIEEELCKPKHQQSPELLTLLLSREESLRKEKAQLGDLRRQYLSSSGTCDAAPETCNDEEGVLGGNFRVKDAFHPHMLEASLDIYTANVCDICRGEFLYKWMFSCRACDFDAHLSCLTADMCLPRYLTDARHEHGLTLRPQSSSGISYTCEACEEEGRTWVYECSLCSPSVAFHPDCVRVNATIHKERGHWLRLNYFQDGIGNACDASGCARPNHLGNMATLSCAIHSWTDKAWCGFLVHADCVAHSNAPYDKWSDVPSDMKRGLREKIAKAKRGDEGGNANDKPNHAGGGSNPGGPKTHKALEALNSIVGLASVKSFVQSLHAQLLMNESRKQAGLPVMEGGALHMIFTGNPGTGKTTVARLVAELLNSMGLLKEGHLVEADRSTLVAAYLGQTAIKTKEVFESALGGVLFVDEAYTLTPTTSSGDQYGEEALATLMKLMEDHRDGIVVILAGYREEMDRMVSKNPGVRSRFPTILEFEDYNAEELMSIATGMLKKEKLELTPEAHKAMRSELSRMASLPQERKKENGNGRAVRNIIEQAKRKQNLRLASDPRPKTARDLQTLAEEDFASALGGKASSSQHQTPEQVLAKLNAVVGLASVKSFVNSLQAQILMNNHRKANGLPVTESGALHMIFTGNPGTGKTTVARIVAELLRSLGLLRGGQLVEADRSTLVAGYSGQTAIKTQEVIRSALGGVLFVDEAYALAPKSSHDNYGEEALATLMKAMEDNRDDLVIILAGYQDEMAQMISSNPGIRSRFPTVLEFEDYNANELWTILHGMLQKEGLVLSPQAQQKVWHQLVDMASLPKEKKREGGNGRAVRNMIENAKRKQALRLSQDPARITATDLQTLEAFDVQ